MTKDEYDPNAQPVRRRVQEVFERLAEVVHVHVGGQVLRTTAEHPVFVVRAWDFLPAGELRPGDIVLSHDWQWVTVEEVFATGEYERVYNLRVEEYHTYFVGGREWGFSVWAHNTYKVSEGTQRRLQHKDLLEQPGMRATRTQKHHPVIRMFRDALEAAGLPIRTPSGRKRGQKRQELETLEHRELHQDWNDFVKSRGYDERLLVKENGRQVLKDALRNKEITPTQIFDAMEQFYTEYNNLPALRSVRRYRSQVQPMLPF